MLVAYNFKKINGVHKGKLFLVCITVKQAKMKVQLFNKKLKDMKTTKIITVAIAVLFLLVHTGCFKNDLKKNEGILPSNFKVDIPDALSYASAGKTSSNILNGNAIYKNLGTFIWVGEAASDVVVGIMAAIAIYNINRPVTLSYQSNEDGRGQCCGDLKIPQRRG